MTGERLPAAQQALATVLGLMAEHGLTLRDIKAAQTAQRRAAAGKATAATKSELMMRLFTYVGGTFIFAGIGLYISIIWSDLASAPRVIITFGTGLVAFILGILFARNPKLEKAAIPAMLIAFLLQPTGLFVLLKEYFGGGDPALGAMVVFGIMAVQQGFTFAALRRTAPLLFFILFTLGFTGAAVAHFNGPQAFATLVTGISLFFLTVDLHRRTAHHDLSPLLFIISTAMLLAGLYYYSYTPALDPFNFAVMLGFLLAAVRLNSRTLYVLAILYIIGYLLHGPGGGWHAWSAYNEWSNLIAGLSVMLAGLWLRRADFTAATPLWLFTGMSYALGGAYGVVYDKPFEIAYIGIAAAGIYGALLLQSRAALAVAIISLIGYISYFTEKHFGDTVGWPLLLVLLGFLLVGAGVFFVRLSRCIAQDKKTAAP